MPPAELPSQPRKLLQIFENLPSSPHPVAHRWRWEPRTHRRDRSELPLWFEVACPLQPMDGHAVSPISCGGSPRAPGPVAEIDGFQINRRPGPFRFSQVRSELKSAGRSQTVARRSCDPKFRGFASSGARSTQTCDRRPGLFRLGTDLINGVAPAGTPRLQLNQSPIPPATVATYRAWERWRPGCGLPSRPVFTSRARS